MNIICNGLSRACYEVEVEVDGEFKHWSYFTHERAAIECADRFIGHRNARVLKLNEDGSRPL